MSQKLVSERVGCAWCRATVVRMPCAFSGSALTAFILSSHNTVWHTVDSSLQGVRMNAQRRDCHTQPVEWLGVELVFSQLIWDIGQVLSSSAEIVARLAGISLAASFPTCSLSQANCHITDYVPAWHRGSQAKIDCINYWRSVSDTGLGWSPQML